MVSVSANADPRRSDGNRARLGLLGLCLLLALALFLNKPAHIDDAVFLRQAEQILKAPLRPFDFEMNWDGVPERAFDFHIDPPLLPYYLALVIGLLGRSEAALHASCLIFPVLALMSFYYLARRFTPHCPLLSVLLFMSCPCFFVTATSLMVDVPVLSFYVAAVALFVWGNDRHRLKAMALGGVAAALAVATKYVGLTLVPLLIAYVVMKRRRSRRALLVLLIPVGVFGLWCLHNLHFYGRIHLASSSKYLHVGHIDLWGKLLGNLSFLGGATILPPLFLLLVRRKRAALWQVGLAVAAAVGLSHSFLQARDYALPTAVAAVLFISGSLLALGHVTLKQTTEPSTDQGFLLLWLWGILIFNLLIEFAAVRFVLLAAPPLVLLFVRHIERKGEVARRLCAVGAVLNGVLCLALAYADCEWAATYRSLARRPPAAIEDPAPAHIPKPKVQFLGHWGWQHYLEGRGYEPMDVSRPERLSEADFLIVPDTALLPGTPQWITTHLRTHRPCWSKRVESGFPVRVMHRDRNAKAGFYCHVWGLLPYAVSRCSLEQFDLYRGPLVDPRGPR